MDLPAFPALDADLTLPGPAGALQARVEYPDADAAPTGVDLSRCMNQTNYAGDSRSNAEISSIGERTGTCPPVLTGSSTR